MSVLPSAKNTWVPSKEFLAAVRECYLINKPIDLTKFSAEDWTQAVAYTEMAEKLRGKNPSRQEVKDFIYALFNCGINFDLESLCAFGNLSFVLDFNAHSIEALNSAVNYIIENGMQKNGMVIEDHVTNYKEAAASLNFEDILRPFSEEYFENWQGADSITAGALLVMICDHYAYQLDGKQEGLYLIEPLAESPKEWNVKEYEFAEFARLGSDKEALLKKFARLFNKPMQEWYLKEDK
jgi:hypothetical protein